VILTVLKFSVLTPVCIIVSFFVAYNIKIDLRGSGWGGINLIRFSQERDKWRILLKTVMNFWVP
jgi:hypothetical protein